LVRVREVQIVGEKLIKNEDRKSVTTGDLVTVGRVVMTSK